MSISRRVFLSFALASPLLYFSTRGNNNDVFFKRIVKEIENNKDFIIRENELFRSIVSASDNDSLVKTKQLNYLIESDFYNGRYVFVGYWMLSETECNFLLYLNKNAELLNS
jgi:hypothetical protein